MFSWEYIPTGFHMAHAGRCPVTMGGDEGEHLDLICRDCGYRIGMQTADYRG